MASKKIFNTFQYYVFGGDHSNIIGLVELICLEDETKSLFCFHLN